MPRKSNKGILDRYLFSEVAGSMAAVTLVLMAIMLSTRFARFVAQAAAGQLPRELLFKVVVLSSLQYLVILIPFSQLLGIMLAMGRLYKDNEIAAMTGCGVGLNRLYRPFFYIGLMLALATSVLAFNVGPWAGRTADYLAKSAAAVVQFNPFEAGRFKDISGRAVFYTADMSHEGEQMSTVFAQINEPEGTSLIIAKTGHQQTDPATGERKVTLQDGHRYLGVPGQQDYDLMDFSEFETRVAPPSFIYSNPQLAIASTATLLATDDLPSKAELQWRLSAPISVFILTLLAVPLSHVGPREGRYGKIVWGIVIYLLYTQLVSLAHSWMEKGKTPEIIGLWWVHLIVLGLAAFLIAQRQGVFVRARAARLARAGA